MHWRVKVNRFKRVEMTLCGYNGALLFFYGTDVELLVRLGMFATRILLESDRQHKIL